MLALVKAAKIMLALVAAYMVSPLSAQEDIDPFRALAAAYAARDAQAAGASYSDQAEIIYRYDGAEEERYRGRDAIASSFADFYGRIDPSLPLDLNFRISESTKTHVSGFYRLRFGSVETSFGRFEVDLGPNGLFERDVSYSATQADFESAGGDLLIAPAENDLDRTYYGLLAGRYRLPDGCDLVVTRSVVRMLVRNSCSQEWRGLNRVTGLEWTGGNRVLSDDVETTYHFAAVDSEPSTAVEITADGQSIRAERQTPYRTEDVDFTSVDGTRLTGTVYVPLNGNVASERLSATLLVHGSGPQDRDGYASVIAVMADALAAEGRVVLAFDKRGSGNSSGDSATADFDILARDAMAGMRLLANREDVDPVRIGLAGSSQAGWIVAKAIELGAEPADVFLLGAAGTAFSVSEQNIYNTGVRMRCAGIAEISVERALVQQEAFFDALRDRHMASRLDQLTQKVSTDPAIADWLFPDSSGLSLSGQWFTVLPMHDDPLPVWKEYGGHATFVYSDLDDSTDTKKAIERAGSLPNVSIVTLEGAQHLGLIANDICSGGLGDVGRFSPGLFDALGTYARSDRID